MTPQRTHDARRITPPPPLDQHRVERAAQAIVAAARRDSAISRATLEDDLERGAMRAWLHLHPITVCTMGEWVDAMRLAIQILTPAVML